MSTGKTKTTSTQTVDPTIMGYANQNFARAQGIADQPFTPYTGGLDLSQSIGTAQGLTNFQAPTMNPAQVNRGNIRDVDAGRVGAEQIGQFMNPYEDQVVGSFLQDSERGRQMGVNQTAARAQAAGAFGGSRHGVAESLTNEAALRSRDSTVAGLRSQGFTTALGAAQQEAARNLQAQLANQGIDITVEQANALFQQQASAANQQASIAGAGVRAQGAGLLGNLEQAEERTAYEEFLRQQNDPLMKMGLLNQTFASLPKPVTTTGTTATTPGAFDYLNMAATLGGAYLGGK